jgi:hypothetical protein
MRSEFAFLFPATKPVRKARKAAAKSIKVGARVILFRNSTEYVVAERDTRYKSAWFLATDAGERLPHSFGRDDMKVL